MRRRMLRCWPTSSTSCAVPPSTPAEDPPPLARKLSPGELRVLRYLPTNLSRPEIADELSVSPNTISTHLRRIYAKLGVDDRSGAVQRARELGLSPRSQTLALLRNCRITPDERGPSRLVPLPPCRVPGTACPSGLAARAGTGRPAMTAPAAKIPAVHQNAVS